VLDVEFLTRFGPGFLRRYYRAWTGSPGGIGLVALDGGRVVGILLGATDPSGHARAMVRGHGTGLALRMAAAAAVRPGLARDLAVTRGRRYARGLWRSVRRRTSTAPASPTRAVPGTATGGGAAPGRGASGAVGEITHLLVDPAAQGRGVGRALVDAAVVQCRAAGLSEVELVTPPDFAARRFYERLGFVPGEDVTSQSGEHFVKYRLPLVPDRDSPDSPDGDAR
jgi:ribosomal protein S18 acetylase RimI-like enzyme